MSDAPQMTVIDPNQQPDAVLRTQFVCYGIMFAKDTDECRGCVIRDRCITILVKKTIPDLRKEHDNDGLTAEEIAEANGSDEATTQILLQIERGKKISELLPPQAKYGEPPPPAPAPEPIVEPASPPAPKKEAKKKVKAEPLKKAALPPPAEVELKAPAKADPPVVPETVAVSGKPVEDAPSPKKAKREAPMKKQTKAEPKAAKSATKVAAPAKKAPAPVKKAAPTKVPAEDFASRWEKERTRSPQVGALKPGHVFEREYKDKTHKVTYQNGFVEYLGKKFPSLAAVMTEIVEIKTFKRADGKKRTMSDWSVPRFFQLGAKKAAPKKKAEATPKKKARKR
jgi:hypothetical protein